jgi:hypothetical protein
VQCRYHIRPSSELTGRYFDHSTITYERYARAIAQLLPGYFGTLTFRGIGHSVRVGDVEILVFRMQIDQSLEVTGLTK